MVWEVGSENMKYEWDENKRQANMKKHGLDFMDANRVYEAVGKLTLPLRSDEERWMDIADVGRDSIVLILAYMYRGEAVRCISFRKASRKERRLYYAERKTRQIYH